MTDIAQYIAPQNIATQDFAPRPAKVVFFFMAYIYPYRLGCMARLPRLITGFIF
jgi:hypothetical protein